MSSNSDSGPYLEIKKGLELNGYSMIEFLGDGTSASVWLALDTHTDIGDEGRWVAIKIMRSSESLSPAALHEAALNDFISRKSSVIARKFESGSAHHMSHFYHKTDNGIHVCMVMQLLGQPLDVLMQQYNYKGIPDVSYVANIVISLLYALDELKSLNIAHTDLKPENILLRDCSREVAKVILEKDGVMPSDMKTTSPSACIKISDFGLSFLLKPENGFHLSGEPLSRRDLKLIDSCGYEKGALIQTREYRAPEIIVGSDFGTESDIWSVGCICYELLTGSFLFDPKTASGITDETSIDIEHLCRITAIVGEASCPEIISQGICSKKFFPNGRFTPPVTDQDRMTLPEFQKQILKVVPDPVESLKISNFILSCLSWNPTDRPTPADLLSHPWLLKQVSEVCGDREPMFLPQRDWDPTCRL